MDSALFFFLMKNYKISVRHHKSISRKLQNSRKSQIKAINDVKQIYGIGMIVNVIEHWILSLSGKLPGA